MIAFAAVQLAIGMILYVFRWGPRIGKRWENFTRCLGFLTIPLFAIYIFMTLYSYATALRSPMWMLIHSLMVGTLVLNLVTRQSLSISKLIALSLPLIVTSSSLAINGPMPLHDDGRFAGFAYRIDHDGGWIPYVYRENTYYQFFHVVPSLDAALSMVTGLDAIYSINPILVLCTTLLFSLTIYVILKNIMGAEGVGLSILGPILFISTPTLATLLFTPYNMAGELFLISLASFSILTMRKNLRMEVLILVTLVSVIGVLTHAIYVLIVLATSITLFFAWGSRAKHGPETGALKSVLRILPLMVLTHWTYTLIMDQMMSIGKSLTQSMVELVTGAREPFEAPRPTWYFAAPNQLAFSWTLLPALVATYFLVKVMSTSNDEGGVRRRIKSLRNDPFLLLGVVGLVTLCLGFALKVGGLWLHRYLYLFYLLLIPTSCASIKGMIRNRKILNCVFVAILIATASFYAVQDPAISPDVHEVILMADKRSWIVAETISQHASPKLKYHIDLRVNVGFIALTLKSVPEIFYAHSSYDPRESYEEAMIVLNLDRLGRMGAERWFEEEMIQAIEKGEYDMVFYDGLYGAYIVKILGAV